MALTHQEIMDGVFHISDGRGNYCTLLVGANKAILYDTLMGFDDLPGYIAKLTKYEPMVINSHCHFDHMGGNYQFKQAFISEKEFPQLETGLEEIPVLEQTLNADLSKMRSSFSDRTRLAAIEPGTIFDLGGMTVEVLALPGHTPGCLGLLCREHRLLLAGDAVSPQMCLFFPESLSLADYAMTLTGLWEVPFDVFLLAHFNVLFQKDILHKFSHCLALPWRKHGMNYTYSILPHLKGLAYVLVARDPIVDGPICLITKAP